LKLIFKPSKDLYPRKSDAKEAILTKKKEKDVRNILY